MKIINPITKRMPKPDKREAKPNKRLLKPLKSIHNLPTKNTYDIAPIAPYTHTRDGILGLKLDVKPGVWHLEKIPKVAYFYWGAKSMSFLRFMSIYSFHQYNPDWKIILYKPKKVVLGNNWEGKQFENKHAIKDYDHLVAKMAEIRQFDFETIGISNDLNEVHKSDLLRYHLLSTVGGLWSDMDILYFRPMTALKTNSVENKERDAFIYIGVDTGQNEIEGHAIGFLMGAPGNTYFKDVFNKSIAINNDQSYEAMGADLLNKHFPQHIISATYPNVGHLDRDEVYFIDHNKRYYLYEDDGTYYFKNYSIGLHWYGGSVYAESLTVNVDDTNFLTYKNRGSILQLLRKCFSGGISFMELDLLLITTNIENRLPLLDNTVQSIERNGREFTRKVMSIDMFPGGKPVSYFDRYKKLGWTIVSGESVPVRGMVENQRRGLEHIKSDFVFYCEDDIVINKVPSLDSLHRIKERLGFICYNTHIAVNTQQATIDRINFVKQDLNYIVASDDVFLVKKPLLRDPYYLNFPAAIIRTKAFKGIHAIMDTELRGLGVEPAMTEGWFILGFDKNLDTFVYVDAKILEEKPTNLEDFHTFAQMNFFNNDVSLRHPSINNRENSLV